jgi:ABC-type uncharacterized transport system involved in gliding motility auxiliary subunit
MAGFSIPTRFTGFARGTIALADVIYFLSLAILGVWLSAEITAERYVDKRGRSLGLGGLLVLFWVGANLLLPAMLAPVRWDLTAGQVTSLSPAARRILADNHQPKQWTFYYSAPLAARYPDVREFGGQVRQMLHAISANSNGLVRVQERIVMPDSDLEDAAIAAGIEAIATDTGEPLYFGLAEAGAPLIARFDPGRSSLLEYDLVRQLFARKSSQLQISDNTDMAGRDWYVTGRKETALYRQLSKQYSLVAETAKLSMLVHPGPWTEARNAQIEARLADRDPLRLVLLIDPYREGAAQLALNGLPRPNAKPSSDLPPAIRELGVQMVSGQVVADFALAAQIQTEQDGKVQTVPWPVWLRLGTGQAQPNGPVPAATERGLVLASAGSLQVDLVDGWQFQPLLVSSDQAMLVPMQAVAANANAETLKRVGTQLGQKILAGLLTRLDQDKQILIIADSDFIDDRFYGQNDPVFGWQEIGDNGRFFTTLLDLMDREMALIDLAPKGQMYHPLTRIENMRQAARIKLQAEEARLAALVATLGEPAQKSAAARRELATARHQLRQVRKSFRTRINWIEQSLVLINVVLFPLGFALFGLFRRRKTVA